MEGDVLGWGIGLIGSLIEQGLVINNLHNLVELAGIVVHTVGVDRDVTCVPGVREPESGNDGEREESAEEDLQTEQENCWSDERLKI